MTEVEHVIDIRREQHATYKKKGTTMNTLYDQYDAKAYILIYEMRGMGQ